MQLDTKPTLGGFILFIRDGMGISSTVLPDGAWAINFCYELSLLVVNQWLNCAIPQLYTQAVYNLAGDNLFTYGTDLPDAPPIPGSESPFFEFYRSKFNINGFVSGVISSASDESTSEGMVVGDWASKVTLQDLQTLKTPYGRAYMAIAQQAGDAIWGLT